MTQNLTYQKIVSKLFKERNLSSKYRLLHVEKVQLLRGDGLLHLQSETWVHLTVPNTKKVRTYLQEHKHSILFFFSFFWMEMSEASIFPMKEQKTPRLLKSCFFKKKFIKMLQLRPNFIDFIWMCWNLTGGFVEVTLVNTIKIEYSKSQRTTGLVSLDSENHRTAGILWVKKTNQDQALHFTSQINTYSYSSLCIFSLHHAPQGSLLHSSALFSSKGKWSLVHSYTQLSFISCMTWEIDDLQDFPFQAVHGTPSISEQMNSSCTVS